MGSTDNKEDSSQQKGPPSLATRIKVMEHHQFLGLPLDQLQIKLATSMLVLKYK